MEKNNLKVSASRYSVTSIISNIFFISLLLFSLQFSLLFPILKSHSAPNLPKVHLVIMGDSLTEGYGIDKDLAYPQLLEEKLKSYLKNKINKSIDLKIYNAGISGSTSASSLSRLKWFLKNKPTHLFLALGANDGLRGVLPPTTKKNLKETIKLAKDNQVKVMLAGMKMPPNYGEKYSIEFEKLFADLAKEENVPFMPFLLENVAAIEKLNQTDGIHPNENGHKIIADNVFQFLIKNIAEFKK